MNINKNVLNNYNSYHEKNILIQFHILTFILNKFT